MIRPRAVVIPVLAVALAAACQQEPVAPLSEDPGLPALAKPPSSCDAYAPLAVTLADAAGHGLVSDGGGAYVELVNGVEAHVNGPTGNLSIWTTASPRSLTANTASGPVTIDRVYTNNHSIACGLRLSSLPVGSTTTAVLEAEERQGGTGSTISIVRYGKDCSRGQGQLDGNPVTVTRPSASTIVITAGTGKYCLKSSGQNWIAAGTVAGFTMTLSP